LGLSADFSSVVGTQEYLRAKQGLTVKSVARTIRSSFEKGRSLAATATATD
jgi:hypothetical protein